MHHITDHKVIVKTRIKKYLGIAILFLSIILLSASASGICLIKGFVLNPDGTAADSNIPVKIRLAGSDIVHTVFTGGHVSNFYLQSIYQCRTGKDVAVIEVEKGGYKVSSFFNLESPYDDLNLTLAAPDDYEPLDLDETSFIKKPSTVGRLVQIKDGKEATISSLDTVLYKFKGFNQKFELKYLGYPFISGVFPNLGSSIGQAVGAVEQYDLDLNGALDTEINLVDIEANRAKLIFRSVTEVFPEVVEGSEEIIIELKEEKPASIAMSSEEKLRCANSLLIFIALVLTCWLIINIILLIKEKVFKKK